MIGWLRSGKPARRAPVPSLRYASSPLLASKTPPWRSKLLVVLVGLGFAGLIGRAGYVQLVHTDFFLMQGEKRYAHTLVVPGSRGRVLDRNGTLLATSVPVPSIWAIPKEFDPKPEQRRELLRLLDMSSRELDERLAAGSAAFAWLRRQVEPDIGQRIAALKIRGLHSSREYRRHYPEGEAAAHVVGFTGLEDRGQEGIELAFDKELAGRDGQRTVVKDRLGRIVDAIGDAVEPQHGRDIALSIDSKVQFFAYQKLRDAVAEHRAKAGSVVVIDVRTGEVLALANLPTYNPAARAHLTGAQLRNRALTDIFEPGSTMKPFIAALALESGRVTPTSMIQTAPGSITITGSTIKDAHPHGLLSVNEVIQKSSNVGTVRMAMQMHPREMWEMFSEVGFGARPQLPFPGAGSGRLRPYKTWRPIEQATMSYGYGLSASLTQLARAYTVFARDGELVPLTMLRHDETVAGVKVLEPGVAIAVRRMLQMAAAEGGTAPKAQRIAQGYSVGGKTGTAHKQEGRGYSTNKYRSWFVGMAPISQPRIVVAVMVDEPSAGQHYGGDVAAPVFAQVVQQTLRLLNVAPDLEVRPQIVTQALPAVQESFQ
ncbi:MAG: peptidoglycan D,D-transpeptidase FtsI family protein [Aquabacterium sp.]